MSATTLCRICGGLLDEFLDLGTQPMANAYVLPEGAGKRKQTLTFRLACGICQDCTMVQIIDEAPHESMFHDGYPYRSSGSSVMRAHFEAVADRFLRTELTGTDPFIVELGSNDGVMLHKIAQAGLRHLGAEPCGDVAASSEQSGVRVISEFFSEELAAAVRAEHGPADVIYAANTFSHVSFIDSVLRGIETLLAPGGVFVFEEPYFGDIVRKASFDQIYDEHIFLFTAGSVREMADRYGFELVEVERLPVHGGEIRYTLAKRGARAASPAVAELIAEETATALTERATLDDFADRIDRTCEELVALLRGLRAQNKTVVGYGATGKSSTLLNRCGIGPELLSRIIDSTPTKQGRLTPGTHIPIHAPETFADPYPDYALLLAWNHAAEIKQKEVAFSTAGGHWIEYVPQVRIATGESSTRPD